MDNERRRSDALHDVARRLGVDVYGSGLDPGDLVCPRPRLDIAHECLGKLSPRIDRVTKIVWALYAVTGPDGWAWYWWRGKNEESGTGIFEEAVIALAERFLKVGIPLTMQPAFPEQALDTPSGEEG